MATRHAGIVSANPIRPQPDCASRAAPELEASTALVRGLAEVIRQRVKSARSTSLGRLDEICNEPVERRFPLSELRALLAEVVRETGEPALGLYWGMHARSSSFGLMTPLISYASTLRHALALLSQFHTLMTDGACFRLEERIGVARLRCDLPPGMNTNEPALVEMMLAGLVRMFEEFGCAIQDLRAVCVEFPRPAHYRTYALAFAGTERFSQPFTGIEFAAEALDRRHMHHHSELQALMVAEAERSLERRQQPRSYAERVLALLSTSQPAQLPAMREMARRLGVGERSLRRRLEAEGTSYLRLTQRHLYNVACSLLRNPNLTLQEIAGALGFGDSAAFHRAFRRWSNATPAEYRHSLRTAATRTATPTQRAPHSEPS